MLESSSLRRVKIQQQEEKKKDRRVGAHKKQEVKRKAQERAATKTECQPKENVNDLKIEKKLT